jgi:hypothetical protein
MIIFGGILDITKELDDMIIFDLDKRKWVQLFEELMLSPIRQKYGTLMLKNRQTEEQYTLSHEEHQSLDANSPDATTA